jgi:signal transduction histidine kinase
MRAVVNDLLLLAQLDAPRPIHHPLVDLDALVMEVHHTLRPLAVDHTLTLGEVEPVQTRGDPDDLKRMILNLAENALKYAPPGGRIVIQCTVQERKDEQWSTKDRGDTPRASPRTPRSAYATVSVTDTGPGIPPEHLPHLFERFYRVDKAQSRQVGGTGLGLAIVKGIAEAHGGWVTVEIQVGKGSTFTVWLPIVHN